MEQEGCEKDPTPPSNTHTESRGKSSRPEAGDATGFTVQHEWHLVARDSDAFLRQSKVCFGVKVMTKPRHGAGFSLLTAQVWSPNCSWPAFRKPAFSTKNTSPAIQAALGWGGCNRFLRAPRLIQAPFWDKSAGERLLLPAPSKAAWQRIWGRNTTKAVTCISPELRTRKDP